MENLMEKLFTFFVLQAVDFINVVKPQVHKGQNPSYEAVITLDNALQKIITNYDEVKNAVLNKNNNFVIQYEQVDKKPNLIIDLFQYLTQYCNIDGNALYGLFDKNDEDEFTKNVLLLFKHYTKLSVKPMKNSIQQDLYNIIQLHIGLNQVDEDTHSCSDSECSNCGSCNYDDGTDNDIYEQEQKTKYFLMISNESVEYSQEENEIIFKQMLLLLSTLPEFKATGFSSDIFNNLPLKTRCELIEKIKEDLVYNLRNMGIKITMNAEISWYNESEAKMICEIKREIQQENDDEPIYSENVSKENNNSCFDEFNSINELFEEDEIFAPKPSRKAINSNEKNYKELIFTLFVYKLYNFKTMTYQWAVNHEEYGFYCLDDFCHLLNQYLKSHYFKDKEINTDCDEIGLINDYQTISSIIDNLIDVNKEIESSKKLKKLIKRLGKIKEVLDLN